MRTVACCHLFREALSPESRASKKKNAFPRFVVYNRHAWSVLLCTMKCQKIAVFKAVAPSTDVAPSTVFAPSTGVVRFRWCRYLSAAALVHIKEMFGNPNMQMDNIVLPTSEAAPKTRVCILYNRESTEAGHALPPNEAANQVILDVFHWPKYTFHGDVAMFYIDVAGTRVSAQILGNSDLEIAVASMREPIKAGKLAMHAAKFSDYAEEAKAEAAEEAAEEAEAGAAAGARA